MISVLKFLSFIPYISKVYRRKYYATGFGTFIVNFIFRMILRINVGGDFLTHFTSRLNSPEKIKIKEGEESSSVYLSMATSGGCYYQAINTIEIGPGTIWANNCSFISANHSFDNLKSHTKSKGIVIGEKVWLGANCVVLPEVSIGNNTIVGAGSVVSKSLPDNVIAVGSPAKIIAKRCLKCLNKIPIGKIEICKEC